MAQKKDLIGKKIGLLTVVKELETKIYSNGRKNYQYECLCDCGNIVKRNYQSLNRKNIKRSNCGCISGNSINKENHGLSRTRTHNTWSGMKQRCLDKNHSTYTNYGQRGITIEDDRWLDFENFYEDMGERPEGMTLDRIDNDRGYCKDNCRWANPVVQSNNRRPSSGTKLTDADVYTIFWMFECGGKTKAQIAREFGVARSTISRIINGKSRKHLTPDSQIN